MSFWDRLRKPRSAADSSPRELQEALLRLVEQQDGPGLERLCRAERDRIVSLFPSWRKIPEAVRSNPAAVQRTGQGLLGIATCFERQLGDRSLVELLIGRPEDNPIVKWQQQLQAARELMDEGRYAEAIPELDRRLAEMSRPQGTASDRYRPLVLGWLGESYFHSGDPARALEPTRAALAGCQEQGDHEGELAYLGNLYEIRRYLGEGEAAADAAEQLAEQYQRAGQEAQAARFRRLSGIARAGEPLNRVVALLGDNPLEHELDELPLSSTARVRFVFRRNRITLQAAERLIDAGSERGRAGDYAGALAAFERAAAVDRYAPQAPYQAGVALLDLGRYGEARRRFAETEVLAPGWYQCRADGALAAQLESGALATPIYLAIRQLQDGDSPPAEKVRMAEAALGLGPACPRLHLEHGKNLTALGRTVEASAAFRRGLAGESDADTRSWLLIHLAGLLAPAASDRRALLAEAAALHGGNLVAAAMATMLLGRVSGSGGPGMEKST